MRNSIAFAVVGLVVALTGQAASAEINTLESFALPGGATQLLYALDSNSLVVRSLGRTLIKVIDLDSRNTDNFYSAHNQFTDLALTPDGQYAFAADDSGGLGLSHVHRLDLNTGIWSEQAVKGSVNRIAALDSEHFAVQAANASTIVVGQWGSATPVAQIANTNYNTSNPNILSALLYDAQNGRIIQSGASYWPNPVLTAFTFDGTQLVKKEATTNYDQATAPYIPNGTLTMASDNSALYFGGLQFDPANVKAVLRYFSENIQAANGDYALGRMAYYDAHNGQFAGFLDKQVTLYVAAGNDGFWGYDSVDIKLVHYGLVPEPASCATMGLGLAVMALICRPRRKTLA